jgi:hypothetical protein
MNAHQLRCSVKMPSLSTFVAFIVAGALASACAHERQKSPTTTAQSAQTSATSAGKASCLDGLTSTGAARADYEELARRCGKGQRPITPVFEGEQSSGQKSQRLKFMVTDAEQCIQVLAAGSAGVEELDLMVRGLDGQPLVRDQVEGRLSVAPSTAVCVRNAGEYEVDVSVTRGHGQFIVGVWSSANAISRE